MSNEHTMKESCDIVAFASSSMWMTLSTNHESEFTYVVDRQLTILILSQNYVIILFQKEIDFRKERMTVKRLALL